MCISAHARTHTNTHTAHASTHRHAHTHLHKRTCPHTPTHYYYCYTDTYCNHSCTLSCTHMRIHTPTYLPTSPVSQTSPPIARASLRRPLSAFSSASSHAAPQCSSGGQPECPALPGPLVVSLLAIEEVQFLGVAFSSGMPWLSFKSSRN